MMAPGYFDDVFLQDARFGQPQWCGADLIVPVHGAILLETHPVADGQRVQANGRLCFRITLASTRVITEYKGDPRRDGYREPYTVVERRQVSPSITRVEVFGFDGVLLKPLAFVDWEVECASFEFEIDELERT